MSQHMITKRLILCKYTAYRPFEPSHFLGHDLFKTRNIALQKRKDLFIVTASIGDGLVKIVDRFFIHQIYRALNYRFEKKVADLFDHPLLLFICHSGETEILSYFFLKIFIHCFKLTFYPKLAAGSVASSRNRLFS